MQWLKLVEIRPNKYRNSDQQVEPKMWNSAAGIQREEGAESSGIRCTEVSVSEQYVVVYFCTHREIQRLWYLYK